MVNIKSEQSLIACSLNWVGEQLTIKKIVNDQIIEVVFFLLPEEPHEEIIIIDVTRYLLSTGRFQKMLNRK